MKTSDSDAAVDVGQLVKKVKSGRLGLHEIDKFFPAAEAAQVRRRVLEQLSGTSLNSIGAVGIDYERVKNRNAENVIGGVQIPLGIAGPLRISGTYANGSFYLPLATTEGALIASVNRGIKAITKSGGAIARVIADSMSRGPVFKLKGVVAAQKFIEWVDGNFEDIKNVANSTTTHGSLVGIRPFILGNNVWLRFSFDTGDAMGMNMATIATEAACAFIEKKFPEAKLVAVSGNMCSDKKSAQINNILGRGKTVVAEAIIDSKTLSGVFGTTAEAINDTNLRKNWLGSARAGSTAFNAHFANIVAAMFLATGQDAAQVVESSSGYTWTEARGGNLYISVTMPSLEVGTVGGGTALSTQSEALSILGVAGGAKRQGANSRKLAEIIACAVLAGELNLIAALSNKEVGSAHKSLGRNKRSSAD